MSVTTHCPKCEYEFEQLRTNKLDYLVLAHRLRGIVSPYAIGTHCPKCNRDCTHPADTDVIISDDAENETDTAVQIEESVSIFDSDECVAQAG